MTSNNEIVVPRPYRYEASYSNTVRGTKRTMTDILQEASNVNHVKLWKSRILEMCIKHGEETGQTEFSYVTDIPLSKVVVQELQKDGLSIKDDTGSFGKYIYTIDWTITIDSAVSTK